MTEDSFARVSFKCDETFYQEFIVFSYEFSKKFLTAASTNPEIFILRFVFIKAREP